MSQHCYPPAPGLQADGLRARYLPRAAARSVSSLPTGPLPPDSVAGTSVGHGRSSAPSHLDPLGRSDPTVRELDPALNGAVLTADAAKLAASADYSPYHQAQRVMPADPHHSGAALIPSTTVGEAVGQERRPSTAANVDSCYGHESKTMTIYRACLTPAEANPPSASGHRLAKPQSGPTSPSTTVLGTPTSSTASHARRRPTRDAFAASAGTRSATRDDLYTMYNHLIFLLNS